MLPFYLSFASDPSFEGTKNLNQTKRLELQSETEHHQFPPNQ